MLHMAHKAMALLQEIRDLLAEIRDELKEKV